MSQLIAEGHAGAVPALREPTVGDYVALLKPRVMSLVVFTALVGMLAAPGDLHPVLGFIALTMIAVGAGASGALNMWYDADIDAHMARTAARPIPRGHVTAEEAFTFGVILAVGSVLVLGLLVNWFAAGLLGMTIAYYVIIYTMWLKRRTPHNIVIGGAAGAFPPMVGWAAVTGTVSLESFVLFLIIFFWTPPHFWSLALYRCRDYERVGVPMLPVTHGPDVTRRKIMGYTLLLLPLAVTPYLIGMAGLAYLGTSLVLGVVFFALALKVYRLREGREADQAARRLFGFSIFYLFSLFAVILGEQLAQRILG
ncbi:MAG TPA: heme o synthase [Hyphomicrobiaceae bacterium]|nr:heme o synthase [Hyphomicrobiaceae bacterium]